MNKKQKIRQIMEIYTPLKVCITKISKINDIINDIISDL